MLREEGASANVVPISSGESPPPSEGGTPPKGGKGKKPPAPKKKKPLDFGKVSELLTHFALIYSTDTVIDTRKSMIMKINALRLAYGTEYVKRWLEDPGRQMILPSQLVFAPDGNVGAGDINLYDGLATEPVKGDCRPLLELLHHLCSESAETKEGVAQVVAWVLRWLAYPLQHPGAKMATALVFHGPQGTGKNLFFEAVAKIYGRYAMVVGQDQLEDKFNDWASQKLFIIGDEVVARQELYHQKNKLKALITGETIQINTKMLPLRTEANHCNLVFLSNEPQPLALEPDDRRYFVVYAPPREDGELYRRVAECLDNGGIAAFLHYLLAVDLGDFNRHTRPIRTKAKDDLVELGLRPPERFINDWLGGYLPLPRQVCTGEQLYRAFMKWCRDTGERFPPPQTTFSKLVLKHARGQIGQKVVKLDRPERGKVSARVWVPTGCAPPPDMTEGQWATEAQTIFELALREFFGQQQGGES